MDVMMVVVMTMVVVVVVARGTRVGGHGEHRQHGGDGEEFGEGHGELLSFFWSKRPERDRGGIMPDGRAPDDFHRAGDRRWPMTRSEPRSGLISCWT
jgi:hypothetical protein